MVQISTRLSRFFRLAWPPASENGAATTVDENKLLMGRFLQWKANGGKNIHILQHMRIYFAVLLELWQKSILKRFTPDEMLISSRRLQQEFYGIALITSG
jgi:hypothetical protein